MRIAVLARRIGRPAGAEETVLSLRDHLAADHDVRLYGVTRDGADVPDAWTTDVAWASAVAPAQCVADVLGYAQAELAFQRNLASFAPDVVLSQHQLAVLGARLQHRSGVGHVVFLHDYSMLPRRNGDSPLAVPVEWAVAYVFRHADRIVANSRHVAERYRERWGVDPVVVHPVVDPEAYRVEERGEKILHVKPTYDKGVDVTLDVAERLPDREFVVVGPGLDADDVAHRLECQENVDYRGYVADIRDVYQETKLVLMPSRWEEPYGRIPVEAGISGIPTLCSGVGGLTEAVREPAFVVESNAPPDYVERIERVTAEYERYARRARENAVRNAGEGNLDALRSLLREVAD